MTKIRKLTDGATAFCLLAGAVILVSMRKDGYGVISAFLSLSLLLHAIRQLVYYIRLARFMVGGKSVFYRGVLLLDAAFLLMALAELPHFYVMLYLAGWMILFFGREILHALHMKKYDVSHWNLRLVYGAAGIVLAVFCLFHYASSTISSLLYAGQLILVAAGRIVNLFRKSAIIYIP